MPITITIRIEEEEDGVHARMSCHDIGTPKEVLYAMVIDRAINAACEFTNGKVLESHGTVKIVGKG
jgi:hypothetical protein